MNQHKFLVAALDAARFQMQYLKQEQKSSYLAAELKRDDTIQTKPDVESDAFGKQMMSQAFPESRFWGEESGFSGPSNAPYTNLQDGLDGTTAFKQGLPTFCVAHGRVDNRTGKLVAAVAVDALERCLAYEDGATSRVHPETFAGFTEKLSSYDQDRVIPVENLAKESVFVDISRAFTRTFSDGSKRVVMTPAQKEYFMAELQRNVKGIHIPGSNILQQMATAMRPNGAAGYFMTAAGGPQDSIGVGFILGAGGAARAFNVREGQLHELDPLAIFGPDGNGYDLLVGARDAKTAGKLVDILAGAYKH